MDAIRGILQNTPPLLLGFLALVVALGVKMYQDPAITTCDIQLEHTKGMLAKNFYSRGGRGTFQAGVLSAFQNCLDTNSPGGCLEILNRLAYFEEQVRLVPQECGKSESAGFIIKGLLKGLRLMVQIGWGDEPPVNKYNKTSWFETSDIGLFCRMKNQYIRLQGKAQWQAFAYDFVLKLPKATELPKKQVWDRSLFSYPCRALR